MSSTITCKCCFKEFEFSEKERNWFAEMGFKEPKKCKSCKNNQKNKRTYTYTPSKKELELKEKMRASVVVKEKVVRNVFDVLGEEDEAVEEEVEVKSNSSWSDSVEDDERMDWSKPIKWVVK